MLKTKINTILLCTLFTLFFPLSAGAQYRNPILYADVPDMSVCRAGDYFYMVSTTMHLMPGAPIMRSPDMKHWETISYVFPRIDDGPRYDLLEGTAYGQGQWASSIRYHDGKFYVWFTANGAPGRGFVYTATDPAGPWKLLSRPPHFHDGSLLFDDDLIISIDELLEYFAVLFADSINEITVGTSNVHIPSTTPVPIEEVNRFFKLLLC